MKKDFLYIQHKRIRILGPSKLLVGKVVKALLYIKAVDEDEYAKVIRQIDTIFITRKRGYTNGMYMPERVWMTNISNIEKVETEWLAAVLVHEAVHSSQFRNGKYVYTTNSAREKPAIAAHERFLKKVERRFTGKGQTLMGIATKAYQNKYWNDVHKDDKSYDYFDTLLDALCDGEIIMTRA